MQAKTNKVAICTIANTPRNSEHCVLYISEIMWKKEFDRPINTDSVEDVKWIYERALERAKQFKIEGVTIQQTLGKGK